MQARGLTVHDDAFLDRGFVAEGEGEFGTVRLINATVHGQLQLAGPRLSNHDGPALKARGLVVDADAYLDRGFTAVGVGPDGTLRLPGSVIQGRFKIAQAHLVNDAGPVLLAERLTATRGAHLDFDNRPEDTPRFPAGPGTGQGNPPEAAPAAVVLTGADLGATLEVSPRTLKAAQPRGRWEITGLTYRRLEKQTSDHWLKFLQHGTVEYSPQPYQQFAAVAQAHGDERLTRTILITQRDDQMLRGRLNRRQKAGLRLLRATVG